MGRREDADTSPFRSSTFPHAPHSGIRARAHPRPNSRLHHRPRSPNKVSAHTLPNQAGALQGFGKKESPYRTVLSPSWGPAFAVSRLARPHTHRGGGPLIPGGPDGSGLRPLPAPARPGPRHPRPASDLSPRHRPQPAEEDAILQRGPALTDRGRPARPAQSHSAPLSPASRHTTRVAGADCPAVPDARAPGGGAGGRTTSDPRASLTRRKPAPRRSPGRPPLP